MRGIDTTASMIHYAQLLKRNGYDFVGRYINAAWKSITPDEKNHLEANGIKIVYIYEEDPVNVAYFTDNQAYRDYFFTLQKITELDLSNDDNIYYTVDYDAPEEDIPKIVAYFDCLIQRARVRRADGYIYPGVGVYGSGRVISAIRDRYPEISTWLAQSIGWAGYYDVEGITIRQGGRDNLLPFDNDTDIMI